MSILFLRSSMLLSEAELNIDPLSVITSSNSRVCLHLIMDLQNT